MKILLIEHPRSINPDRCNDIANTPLSSCLLSGYAAASLRSRGHEVEIVEGFLDQLTYDGIAARARDFKPALIGVHIVYHWKRDEALYGFLARIKEEISPYIAAYGYFPSIAPDLVLEECAAIGSVILGEPEDTFAELAEAVSAGKETISIKGTAARDTSGNIQRVRRELEKDLDSLPFPVRTEALYRISEVNILGSRGCYGKCTFCYINGFYGQGSLWRSRSPRNIIAEIDGILAERGKRDFYFTDPNFFGPGVRGQERALSLASLLKQRNIAFGIEGRVNDIHDRTIEAMAGAGLRNILIGLESGNDSALSRMNKMTTVQQNETALRVLRKHGIEPNVGFIMFEPYSSLQDIRANFEFLVRNELLGNLPVTANVLYHHQIVLKGTPAYRELAERGALVTPFPDAYEGTAEFSSAKVGALASIMRNITNFLFDCMSDIWSGRIIAAFDSRERYVRVNDLLVGVFDDTLRTLESGEALGENEIAAIAGSANKKITQVLNDLSCGCTRS